MADQFAEHFWGIPSTFDRPQDFFPGAANPDEDSLRMLYGDAPRNRPSRPGSITPQMMAIANATGDPMGTIELAKKIHAEQDRDELMDEVTSLNPGDQDWQSKWLDSQNRHRIGALDPTFQHFSNQKAMQRDKRTSDRATEWINGYYALPMDYSNPEEGINKQSKYLESIPLDLKTSATVLQHMGSEREKHQRFFSGLAEKHALALERGSGKKTGRALTHEESKELESKYDEAYSEPTDREYDDEAKAQGSSGMITAGMTVPQGAVDKRKAELRPFIVEKRERKFAAYVTHPARSDINNMPEPYTAIALKYAPSAQGGPQPEKQNITGIRVPDAAERGLIPTPSAEIARSDEQGNKNDAWTQAKTNIEKAIKGNYTDADLDAIAKAVIADTPVPTGKQILLQPGDENSEVDEYTPASRYFLSKAGIDFNGRVSIDGDSELERSNEDVLRAWAGERLERIGKRPPATSIPKELPTVKPKS